MSRYKYPTPSMDYSKFGKISDNFENVKRDNPMFTPKYDANQSRLMRERIAARSRSPVRQIMKRNEQLQNATLQSGVYSRSPNPNFEYGASSRFSDPRFGNLKFYGEGTRIFGNNPDLYNNRLDPSPNVNHFRHNITSESKKMHPKTPMEEDARNAKYKERYNDVGFLARKSKVLNSPPRQYRADVNPYHSRRQRNSTKVGRPRRASLTMKEALENNEIRKHDVKNFRMYESPRPSQSLRRSRRNSVTSNDSRIEYPNDPRTDENNFSNFHSKERRDRYVQEYPVVPNNNGYGGNMDRAAQMRRHVEMNNSEPGMCGTGGEECQLI